MSIVVGQIIVNSYSVITDVGNILNKTFDTTSVPTTSQVEDIIIRNDNWIDQVSGHNWRSNTVTNEQYDARGTGPKAGHILLKNSPVISVDKVEYWDGTALWVTGKTGFPSEFPSDQTYYSYLPEGKIVWHKLRLDERLRYRVSYTWGYLTVPDFVRDLSASLAAREVVLFWGGQLGLQEDIAKWKDRIDQKIERLVYQSAHRPFTAVG